MRRFSLLGVTGCPSHLASSCRSFSTAFIYRMAAMAKQ
jgi:hypothetical protein